MMPKQRPLTILIASVLLLCLVGGIYWVLSPKEQLAAGLRPEDYLAVEAEKVRRGSIVRRITAVGTLIAEKKVVIRPEISGKITKIFFEGGTPVEANAPLIEIDDRMYRAQVKEAEARFELTKSEYSRSAKLAEKSAGTLKNLEKSAAELKTAEAQLDIAKIKLANTVIRAPFAGVVGLKDVSVGTFVDERTDLLTLVDVDPILLDFRLPGSNLKVISVGQTVNVTVDGFENKVFKAVISAIDAKVDPAAHSIAVRASIPNKRGLLKPGLFARVRVVTGAKDNALLLPESSVLSRGDEEYVYRVVDVPFEGVVAPRAMKTFVTTGLSESGTVEIVKGLKEGDLVVTVGQAKIRPGYPVRIVEDIDAAAKDEDEDEGAPADGGADRTGTKDRSSRVEEKADAQEKAPGHQAESESESAAADADKAEPATEELKASADGDKSPGAPAENKN